MLSQVEQVVANCDDSFNTEMDIIAGLATEARRKNVVHNIIVVVEMGDMREGILPEHLEDTVSQILKTEGVALKGIATNFACLSCVAPTPEAMTMLSSLAVDTERTGGSILETVSGGGSANLPWALGKETTGQINNLRLGEAILLGTDPISGHPIDGLYTDAFKLLAEVIETKAITKQNPVLSMVCMATDRPSNTRSILAIGLQDTDAAGLTFPAGVTFIGATSDHIVIETTNSPLRAGDEMTLHMKYSALTRSMAAPDVAKIVRKEKILTECIAANTARPSPN